MSNEEIYWLAGLLEGEGSFMKGPPSQPNCPIIALQMTDEDVVARAAAMMATKYWCYTVKNKNWKPVFQLSLRGRRAVELMLRLKSLMGERRQSQIDAAVKSWTPPKQQNPWDDEALLIASKTMSLRRMGNLFGRNYQTIRRRLKQLKTAA